MGIRSSSLYPCRDSGSYRQEERFRVVILVNIMEKVVYS